MSKNIITLNKKVIIFCYLEFDEYNSVEFWNSLAVEFEKKNLQLIMFTTIGEKYDFKFPVYYCPYDLSDFDEWLKKDCGSYSELFFESLYLNQDDLLKKKRGAAKAIAFVSNILQRIQPSFIFLWGQSLESTKIFKSYLTLMGFPNAIIERGYYKQTLMINVNGMESFEDKIHVYNSLKIKDKNLNYYQELYKKFLNDEIETKRKQFNNKDKIEILKKIKKKNKIIFLIGHNDFATNFRDNSYFHIKNSYEIGSTKEALELLVNYTKKNKNSYLVFKPHPNDGQNYNEYLSSENNLMIANDLNIIEVTRLCDILLPMSTTSIYELVFCEKPILALTNTSFSHLSGVKVLRRKDDLTAKISEVLDQGFENKIKNYINSILENNLFGNNLTYVKNDFSDLANYVERCSIKINRKQKVFFNNNEFFYFINLFKNEKKSFLKKLFPFFY